MQHANHEIKPNAATVANSTLKLTVLWLHQVVGF